MSDAKGFENPKCPIYRVHFTQPPKSTFSADGKSPESPVFKPFFRRLSVFYICHQYHALNVTGGAGIGLTITKAIIDAHKGTIHLWFI